MKDYTTLVKDAGDRVIDAISGAEDAIVSAVSTAAETVGGLIPALPTLPMTEQIPAPKQLVETGFGLVERLVDAQKAYTIGLLDALSPVTDKLGLKVAKKPARKSTAKETSAA